jgi:hypothetical protein
MPHWEGWRERGPLTFLVFSNWEFTLKKKWKYKKGTRAYLPSLASMIQMVFNIFTYLLVRSSNFCFVLKLHN